MDDNKARQDAADWVERMERSQKLLIELVRLQSKRFGDLENRLARMEKAIEAQLDNAWQELYLIYPAIPQKRAWRRENPSNKTDERPSGWNVGL